MSAGPLRPIAAAEARRLLLGAVPALPSELVALEQAAGRVLATALVASEDVPAFPRAAMDGYAVRAADLVSASGGTPARLTLVGAVAMGEAPADPVAPGQARAIPTGGHLPAGADAVVMVEHTALDGTTVLVRAPLEAGRHVVWPGDDVRRGTTLIPAGRRLGPRELAALATFGVTRVPVQRRPRVAVLSTGPEICPPGETPPPGKVRDVNQVALAAGAQGAEVTLAGIAADDVAALTRALAALAGAHDLVLVSGGSSVGGRDHTAEAMAAIGSLLFHGVQCRPGRPTLGARAGSALLVGLPGVPAAALIMFQVFVRPVLEALSGAPPPLPRPARLIAGQASEPGREDYLRVKVRSDGGAEVLAGGTGALAALLACDGLVIVPAEAAALAPGTPVDVWPWP
jgi:molybdopterin molybdotransferase